MSRPAIFGSCLADAAAIRGASNDPVPGRSRGDTTARILLIALAGAGLAVAALAAWQAASSLDRGAALFNGGTPRPARLAGHDDELPPQATRCSNCHGDTDSLGPALGSVHLARPAARRGGPPSRYDEASLCRLMRDGVDPTWVLVDRTMPRYAVSDADCDDLWRYLSSR